MRTTPIVRFVLLLVSLICVDAALSKGPKMRAFETGVQIDPRMIGNTNCNYNRSRCQEGEEACIKGKTAHFMQPEPPSTPIYRGDRWMEILSEGKIIKVKECNVDADQGCVMSLESLLAGEVCSRRRNK